MINFFQVNIATALNSIRGHKLRTVLTVFIIALGITALVGILTTIDSIKASINKEFTMMGANTFTIRNRGIGIRIGKGGKGPKRYRPISFKEASSFKNSYNFPSTISISMIATWAATVKYRNNKTNPNIGVIGGDENYLKTGGFEIAQGRNFTSNEVQGNSRAIILGNELVNNLFKENEDPVNKVVGVGNKKFVVIGVLKEKGSSIGFGGDKNCIIPLGIARQVFEQDNTSYTVSVMAMGSHQLDQAIGEAESRFRVVRKDRLYDDSSFEIIRSDSLSTVLIENLGIVTLAATIISIITLLGAAVGLMNIMLVSVVERTREIGTRKAIGATPKTIRQQFITEAIVICQLGGITGILIGIPIGNILSFVLDIGFVVPWQWIIMGIIICVIVGVIAGYYPARKASQLDPIDALRYE